MKNKNSHIKRVITGACLMLVLVPAVYFGGLYFLIVSILLSAIGTYELMDMFYKKNPNLKYMRFILPIISAIIVVGFYFAINNKLPMLTIIPYVIGVLISMSFGVFKDGSEASDILSCITGITYGGLLFACAVSVEYLEPLKIEGQNIVHTTGRLFAYLYSIVAFTDIFAYVFGCAFGKHRLCEKISPKKSVEGAVAGLVLGSVIGTVLGIVLKVVPLDLKNVIILFVISIVLSAMVQIGDLVASKLKRSYEIKDYGFIFPGHGGVMDRFDSLIFAGSIFFILMQIIYLFL